MVDDKSPDDGGSVDIDEATAILDSIKNQTSILSGVSDNMNKTAANYIDTAKMLEYAAAKGMDIEKAKEAVANINRMGTSSEKASGFISSMFSGATTALNLFKKSFDGVGSISKGMNNLKRDMIKAADAGGAIFTAQAFSNMADKIDRVSQAATGVRIIKDLQEPLYETRKAALQFGIGFGQSFEQAKEGMKKFQTAMAESQVNTRSTREELIGVQKALKEAFKPDEMNRGLKLLSSANKDFQSALTNTNIALLVSKATGIESATAAGMLAKAHLELGESVGSAPMIFAQIAHAAEKSGLQYNKVAESVMKSADALKMWGGTIGSITPIFNAFSRSLGEGQKGLAVDLVQKYVSGIQGLSFEMRALVGLTAGGPGAQAGGAIGAGLEQEALLADGEAGMAQFSENLIGTIKQMSGQEKMITFQEARESPELQNAFMVQRGLIKQQLKLSDDQANKMIDALQEVDEGGIEVGRDMSSRLNELATAGEKTAVETTNLKLDAQIGQQATMISQGDKLIDLMADNIGGNKLVKKIQAERRKMARGEQGITGAVSNVLGSGTSTEDIYNEILDKARKIMGRTVTSKKEKEQVKEGSMAAEKLIGNTFRNIADMAQATTEKQKGGFDKVGDTARQRMSQGKNIQTNLVRDQLNDALSPIQKRIDELKGKGKGTTNEEAGELIKLREGRNQLRNQFKKKRINLSDFGSAGGMDEKPKDSKTELDLYAVKALKQWQKRQASMREIFEAGEKVEETDRPQVSRTNKQEKRMAKVKRSMADAADIQNKKDMLPVKEAQTATQEIKKQSASSEIIKRQEEVTLKVKVTSNKEMIILEAVKDPDPDPGRTTLIEYNS